jgi:hypothetical protein
MSGGASEGGEAGGASAGAGVGRGGGSGEPVSPLRLVTDLREHDVGYSMRCGIDLSLRIGAWFSVTPNEVSDWEEAAAAAAAVAICGSSCVLHAKPNNSLFLLAHH